MKGPILTRIVDSHGVVAGLNISPWFKHRKAHLCDLAYLKFE